MNFSFIYFYINTILYLMCSIDEFKIKLFEVSFTNARNVFTSFEIALYELSRCLVLNCGPLRVSA